VRRVLRLLFRRALRLFFRRIELSGVENVPADGPVVFVVNHPNSLVDPLLLLCFAPRRVSFLAKAPLFDMFLVGSVVRAFGSIPVHRRQDAGSDLAKNRQTFDAARRLLAGGGTLALFPEGASHDAPRLLPMKTGAARIALGAAARMESALSIVPAGLFYTRKQTFRSAALVLFGPPLAVEPTVLDADGEPSPGDARALTEKIGEALGSLVLQAETTEALDLVRRAQRIFEDSPEPALAEALTLSRRFVEGHRALAAKDPARLERIRGEILRFEADRREAGLTLADLEPDRIGPRAFARLLAQNLGTLLLAPLAAAGAVIHYPAYRLVGFLARRVAERHEDVLSTVKVGMSMLVFPAMWAAGAYAAFRLGGWPAALATLVLLPVSGWAALRAAEALDSILARAWALIHAAAAKTALKRLLVRREAIRREIRRIAEELDRKKIQDP
jgi:glycerol-3-phosphate O-acyltransferase/dihydroxyacetone phosphate acyltransferase